MAVFSTIQNRHFYVVTGKQDPATVKGYASAAGYPDATKAGHTALQIIGAHDNPAYGMPAAVTTAQAADAFEFLYVNAIGEITHSDLIWKHSIRSVRLTKAADMEKPLQTFTITRDTSITAAKGDNKVWYITFRFPAFQNATDEEVQSKVVSFPWDSNDNDWADSAARAINAAFAPKHNMYNKLVVASKSSANVVQVYAPEGGPFILGQHTNKPTRMEVGAFEIEIFDDATLNTIPGSNDYRVKTAGTVADVTSTSPAGTIKNTKAIQDLEWFCMGERGDQFRLAAFPNQIQTPYMVDATKEYDTLDIQFYFQGEGTRADKSEKHITLVAEAAGSNSVNAALQAFYDMICGNSSQTEQGGGEPNAEPGEGGNDNRGGK